MNRKVTVTLRELDLRHAGRMHVLSWMRDPHTMARVWVIWISTMALLVGFLQLTGMPWPKRLLVALTKRYGVVPR